jgi:hypothetical protein
MKKQISQSDEYWKIMQQNIDWIKFSDQKAGLLLSIYGIIATLLYTNSKDVYTAFETDKILLVIGVSAIACASISIYFCFQSINPRFKNLNPQSIIFFGHISAHKTYRDYLKHSKGILENQDDYECHLAEQIYINAQISKRKFENVAYGIRFFIGFIGSLILSILIYLL